MIINNSWESLVGIVIWVFILSFIILGIVNLIINTNKVVINFEEKKIVNILKNNTMNIVKNLDTTNITEWENFYLFKDYSNNSFKIFTWATNNTYEYINANWTHISDIDNFDGNIFTRTLWIERNDSSIWDSHQVIKANVEMY